jgi:hypothetical protein
MKPKLLLGLALVLSGVYTAFALAYIIQLKPAEMKQHPDILIRSALQADSRNYCVVLLPQPNFPISTLQCRLEVVDAGRHLASCPVDGITLSDVPASGWGGVFKNEYYRVMTNRFSRPLNGARVFTFEVATNLLALSTFNVGEFGEPSVSRWFYLGDFKDEK